MGAVYKATQTSLQRPVAIKILPAGHLQGENGNFATRFRQEAVTMAKLSHQNVVSVFETGEAGGLLYIVMEFIDGTDVAKLIAGEGRLAPEKTVAVLMQVCDALQYAHSRGVVHRDIKPANLLVTREGQVKIADFGLAKLHGEGDANFTQTNVAIGTPEFIAPEAWSGEALDARADVYSLGVTLYQMLTGKVPRGLWKMPSTMVGTDPRFDAIIDRAMQPEREERYSSATELRRALEEVRAETAVAGRARRCARAEPDDEKRRARSDVPYRANTPSSDTRRLRRRVLTAFGIVQLLIVVAVIALWPRLSVYFSSRGKEPSAEPVPPPPTVHDAARWLVQERAQFRVQSQGREFDVKSEADIAEGDFEIVYLWFDRWPGGAPQPPPPAKQFEVLRDVKTLRFVYLRLPNVSESAFGFLAGNPDLKTLMLETPDVPTDATLDSLSGLRHLEKLMVAGAPRLTGHNLASAAWLPQIVHLDFLATSFDDTAVQALTNCLRLNHLRVHDTDITRASLRTLTSLPRLTELTAGGCRHISEQDWIDVLPLFHRLKRLELENSPYGDNLAAAIAGSLTNLTELRLNNTQLTDAGLARLATLPRLANVRLFGTRVTAEGLGAFAEANPKCKIER